MKKNGEYPKLVTIQVSQQRWDCGTCTHRKFEKAVQCREARTLRRSREKGVEPPTGKYAATRREAVWRMMVREGRSLTFAAKYLKIYPMLAANGFDAELRERIGRHEYPLPADFEADLRRYQFEPGLGPMWLLKRQREFLGSLD